MINNALTIVYLLMGLYFIYSGVTKKGGFYNNPNIAEDKQEQYKKDMSVFMLVSGPLLTAGSVLELLNVHPVTYAVCYAVVILCAIVIVYRIRAYTKKV